MILLPHGGYPLIACTLSTMAWMTTMSHDGCDFARLTGPATTTLTAPNEYPFVELGFSSYRVPVFYEEYNEWQIRYSDACRPYDVFEDMSDPSSTSGSGSSSTSSSQQQWIFDFFWKVGSASHQIGLVLGGASCLFLWVSATCAAITKLNWRLLGVQLTLATFFHLSSFLWFFNGLCYTKGTECHWFYGSNSLIAALLLYFLSVVSIFAKYPEPTVVKIVRNRVEAGFQRYEYTEATNPPSEFDDASGIHSLTSHGNSYASSSSKSFRPNSRQRSQQREIIVWGSQHGSACASQISYY